MTLASSSSGNCALAEYGGTRLLIDAGLSYTRIQKALEQIGILPDSLSAILLTHEHWDHVSGLAALMKRSGKPVYTTYGSFEGLARLSFFERLPKQNFHLFHAGESFHLGDFTVRSLPVRHDAGEPVAFRLEADGVQFASVTDLGEVDEALVGALSGLNALLLEANHDTRMLEMGPYPYPLKLRIAGSKGHLSNEMSAGLLCRLAGPELKAVILGHLSQTNNYPLLALETAKSELIRQGIDPKSFTLTAAPPEGFSETVILHGRK